MLENGKISIRQLTVLVMLITIGDSILVLPSIAAYEAHQDAWISFIFSLIGGLGALYIYSKVGQIYPSLTLVEALRALLGKWIGTCTALLFLFYLFLTTVAYMREIGDFITIEILKNTPAQAIQIVYMAIMIMAVRLGLEVIVRAGEIFMPVILLFFTILVVLLSPQIQFENIQPVLENGIRPVLKGSIACIAFPFLESFVLLMIFPYIKRDEKSKRALMVGTLLGGIVLIITILMAILVLGYEQTARSMYPSYSLARRVSVGRFFERVEAMLATIWLLTLFIKATLYFYVLNLGLAQTLKLRYYRMLTFPLAMLTISFAPVIAPNVTYYNAVISRYWPFFDITYGLCLPLLMLGVYYIRKKTNTLRKN